MTCCSRRPLLNPLHHLVLSPPNTGIRSAQIAAFTYVFNLSGHPAISLPCHRDEGLPIGVQLVASHGHEDLLLQVSAELEQGMTWTTRTLPVDLDLAAPRQTSRDSGTVRPIANQVDTSLMGDAHQGA
jgi:Amidase